MRDTTQTEPEGPFAATPREELERQVMDPNVPKMEREWWAADEITRLRAEVNAHNHAEVKLLVEIDELRAEVERLKAARDLVLEEAARVAEAYPARTHGALATAPYAAAEQAADEIAAAIRALKSGK